MKNNGSFKTMKYAGMPSAMWMLYKKSFRNHLVSDLGFTDDDAIGGASDFVREYTLASGGPYCDCGYKKRNLR